MNAGEVAFYKYRKKTVSIDTMEAIEYAENVWEKQRNRGFYKNYRYLRISL